MKNTIVVLSMLLGSLFLPAKASACRNLSCHLTDYGCFILVNFPGRDAFLGEYTADGCAQECTVLFCDGSSLGSNEPCSLTATVNYVVGGKVLSIYNVTKSELEYLRNLSNDSNRTEQDIRQALSDKHKIETHTLREWRVKRALHYLNNKYGG